jgi:Big-like domain-containing protein/chitobiase/beta-hexosaminidase-like protein
VWGQDEDESSSTRRRAGFRLRLRRVGSRTAGVRPQVLALAPVFTVIGAIALLVFATGVTGANKRMLANPSLEQWSGNTPTCWLLGGYGSNTYNWSRTSESLLGLSAVQLSVTALTSGDRKLLTAFNSSCSPAVTAGHVYSVTVWYESNANPLFFAFRPNSIGGGYSFWAKSAQVSSAARWTRASWTTPPIPHGTSFLSVGFGLQGTGTLKMDAFSMVDSTGSAAVDTTPPAASITCNGSPCRSYYSAPASVGLAAADETGGSGVGQIRYTTDGSDPTATTGNVYTSPFTVARTTAVRFVAVDNAGNVSPVVSQTIALDQTAPSVTLIAPVPEALLSGTATVSASAWDDVAVSRVDFFVDGTVTGRDATGSPYAFGWDTTAAGNGTHTIAARAVDEAGNVTSSAAVSVTVSNAVSPPPVGYFSTLPSGAAGLPRGDSYCAANVTASTWEPRADNYAANHQVPGAAVQWSNAELGTYWAKWVANRGLVTGNYTGTTNQIIQWAACKWGLDEDLLRAVAVQESDWHESMVGDNCGVAGEASYGLFQVKNAYCSGGSAWGGYPYTATYTGLNADFYGAFIRSCLDDDFYDGGSWLYGGRTIAQIVAASGFDYAVWGCVGAWFSGGWYDTGAKTYIASVQQHLANRDWLEN